MVELRRFILRERSINMTVDDTTFILRIH